MELWEQKVAEFCVGHNHLDPRQLDRLMSEKTEPGRARNGPRYLDSYHGTAQLERTASAKHL